MKFLEPRGFWGLGIPWVPQWTLETRRTLRNGGSWELRGHWGQEDLEDRKTLGTRGPWGPEVLGDQRTLETRGPWVPEDLGDPKTVGTQWTSYHTIFSDFILGWYYYTLGWKFLIIFNREKKELFWNNKTFIYLFSILKYPEIIPK